MSELIDLEDLETLTGEDLTAVFRQVEASRLVTALASLAPLSRQRLLTKLARSWARRLAAEVAARGSVADEAALAARQGVIEVLGRLSRHGQVAFDDPGDILDLVA